MGGVRVGMDANPKVKELKAQEESKNRDMTTNEQERQANRMERRKDQEIYRAI